MSRDYTYTSFGIIAACSGDSVDPISGLASIGYDTDTIATIMGWNGGHLMVILVP